MRDEEGWRGEGRGWRERRRVWAEEGEVGEG